MRIVTALLLGSLVLACDAFTTAKIDGSSPDAAKASIEKVRAQLSPEDLEHFNESLMVVLGETARGSLGALLTGATNQDQLMGQLLQQLDGQTAQQVIANADQIKAERAEQERTQAVQEIAELRAKKEKAEQAKAQLAQFQVKRSRFYRRDQQFMGPQPIIELAVTNGTASAVSRAYFKGTLATPGRSVPWLVEDFNHSISGGLEPGESAEWSLAPNMFSAWGNVEVKPDMVFTVVTTRLDGADGEKLFEYDWSDDDEKRMAALVEKYGTATQ